MNLTKGTIVMVILGIVLTNCVDIPTGPVKTNTEHFTTGTWILSDWKVNGSSKWDSIDACIKDNLMTFKSDGTFIKDEGAIKCVSGTPQTSTKNWAFIDNETEIIIDGDTSYLMGVGITDLILGLKVGPIDDYDIHIIYYSKK